MSYSIPYTREFERYASAARAAGAGRLVDDVITLQRDMPRNGNKRRRVNITDQTSYQQWRKYIIRSGRKKNAMIPILRSNLVRIDYGFKALTTFNSRGMMAMMMNRSDVSSGGEYSWSMPIYTVALNAVVQGARSVNGEVGQVFNPSVFRGYVRTGDGSWSSNTQFGTLASGSVSDKLTYSSDHLEDVGAMGPSGYLKWTDAKLNLWGAKFKQTVFYIDICRAIEPESNPYRFAPNTLLPPIVGQHLDEIMRPLTVNPIATANNLAPSPWKVLKRIKVELDPTQSTEGDPDPHCKTIDLFNRWGRIVDFKDATYSPSPIQQYNSSFVNPNVGVRDTTTSTVNMWPDDDKLLFLVIRCNCFSSTEAAEFNNAVNPSFDINFRSSWAKLN